MKKNNLEKNIKTYLETTFKLSQKLKLQVRPVINFKKGKVTLFGKFAIYLLKKAGGFIDTQFTNLKK